MGRSKSAKWNKQKNNITSLCRCFFLFLLVPKMRKYLLFDQYFVALLEQAKNIILFACGLFRCLFCFFACF